MSANKILIKWWDITLAILAPNSNANIGIPCDSELSRCGSVSLVCFISFPNSKREQATRFSTISNHFFAHLDYLQLPSMNLHYLQKDTLWNKPGLVCSIYESEFLELSCDENTSRLFSHPVR